jgi:5-methylcytosine-specific restriction endonuclease McrA
MMLVKYGDPLKRMVSPKGFSQGKTCCMVGCVTPTKKLIFVELKFYCKAHYTRLRKYGDPHFIMKPRRVPKEEKKQRRADACRRYNKTPHGRMRLQFNKAKVRAAKYGCDSVTGIPQEVFIALHSRTHCAICGQFMPENDRTLDHIVALSEGGANSPNNLQTVHLVCNCRKGGARGRRAKQYVPPPAKKVTHSSVAASPGT